MAKKTQMSLGIGILAMAVVFLMAVQFNVISLGGPGQALEQVEIVVTQAPVLPGEVPVEIRGESVTAPVNVYDADSDTNAELTSTPLGVYRNGVKILDKDAFNSSISITGVDVGDRISVYGVNNGTAPTYIVPIKDYLLTSRSPTISMVGYTGATETELQITCWDSNAAVFEDGGNATYNTLVDYNISLGASAAEQLTCRVKVNAADNSYMLKGLCVGYINDVDYLRLEGETEQFTSNPVGNSAWSEVIVPKHVKDGVNTDGGLTAEYDICYTRADAIRLSEWDWVKLQFTMAADSTGCGFIADGLANSTADMAWMIVKDEAYGEGADGTISAGIADKKHCWTRRFTLQYLAAW